MIKKILILLILFILVSKCVFAGDMSAWDYEAEVKITNGSGGALNAHQVLLTLDTASLISAGKMESDGKDIRFTETKDDDTTLLDYWIETNTINTTSTNIWIKVDCPAGLKSIYIYYGNAAAVAQSNGPNTFEFFDDFESYGLGALVTANWIWEAANVSPSIVDDGGSQAMRLTPQNNGEGPVLVNIASMSNMAIHAQMRDANNRHFHIGRLDPLTIPVGDYGIGFWIYSARSILYRNNVGYNSWTSVNAQSRSISLTTYHSYKYLVDGTNFTLYEDDVQINAASDGTYANGKPALMCYNTEDTYVDNFFVRKYTTTEPTTQIFLPVEKLVFTTSEQQVTKNQVSEVVTIETQSEESLTTAISSAVTLNLNTTSATGEFSLTDSPFTPMTQVTIAQDTSFVNIYYRDSIAGVYTISASENPSQGWTDASQTITILTYSGQSFEEDINDWNYNATVGINNSSGGALTDYQILLRINTAALVAMGKMNINGDDIRFIDSDRTTPLPYWIESGMNTSETRIWIKVPLTPASSSKDVYMYYGNASASAASSGVNTFVFFDDFDSYALGALSSNDWVWDAAYVSPAIVDDNGLQVMRLTPEGGGEGPILANVESMGNMVIHVKMKDVNNQHFHIGRLEPLTTPVGDYGLGFWIYPNQTVLYRNNAGYNSWTSVNSQSRTTSLTTYHSYQLFVNSTTFTLYEDDTQVNSASNGAYTSGRPALMCYRTEDTYLDNFFVRKYADPEPTVNLILPITKLAFTTSEQTIYEDRASSIITIQTQDDTGASQNVSSDTIINLGSGSESGQFSLNASFTEFITSVTISSGHNSVSFYYRDSTVGTFTISASETPSQEWTDASQDITVLVVELVGKYKRAVTITNFIPEILSGYQIQLIMDTATLVTDGKMQADGADIRFLDSDDLTPISYWIESGMNTATTRIWIKVPSIPASSSKDIYLYYGNNLASAGSSGEATFEAFDDFESYSLGSLTSDRWIWDAAYVSPFIVNYSGSQAMRLTPEGSGEGPVLANIPSMGNMAIHVKIRDVNNRHYHIGRHETLTTPVGDYGIGFWIYSNQAVLYRNNSGYNSWSAVNFQSRSLSLTSYHSYQFYIDGSLYSLVEDDIQINSYNDTTYAFGRPGLLCYRTEDLYVDDFLVRKYVSTEPGTSLLLEDTVISQLTFTTLSQTLIQNQTSVLMTIETQDTGGNAKVVSVDTDIELDTTSMGGQFAPEGNPSNWSSNNLLTITISAGKSSASFYYKDSIVGTPTITASEYPSQGWTNTSQQQTINSAVNTFLVETDSPQVAGTEFTLTITAIGDNGQISTNYFDPVDITVHYVSPDTGSGTLCVTSTSTFVNGVATITDQCFSDCGTITITACKAADPNKNGTSNNTLVVPYDFTAVVTGLDMSSAGTKTHTVGKPFALTVTAMNSSAQTCPNYRGTADLTVDYLSPATDQSGSLNPDTLTADYWTNGVAELEELIYDKWGAVTFTVTDATLDTQTGTSSSVNFVPKDFVLTLSDPPPARTFYYLDEEFTLTVTARDFEESTLSNYGGMIRFAGPGLSLPEYYTFLAKDAGTVSFDSINGTSAVEDTAISVTDTAYSDVSGSSDPVTIKEASIKVFSSQGPVGDLSLTVAIIDEEGDIITRDDSTIFTVTLEEGISDNSATSDTISQPGIMTEGRATIIVTDDQVESVTVIPFSTPTLESVSGTATYGSVSGSGIGIQFFRELKDERQDDTE
ncbi:MAG: DUF2341 domain-containing protein [Candidatus Omnitrophica bacterium]|nr:DUF2341 domain-containing protein [Candidatus Omnitrophota bacterium]